VQVELLDSVSPFRAHNETLSAWQASQLFVGYGRLLASNYVLLLNGGNLTSLVGVGEGRHWHRGWVPGSLQQTCF
jgi:hypothetical protein